MLPHGSGTEKGQHDAAPDATSKNLARLVEYFGKTKPLTDIDHDRGDASWSHGGAGIASRAGKMHR